MPAPGATGVEDDPPTLTWASARDDDREGMDQRSVTTADRPIERRFTCLGRPPPGVDRIEARTIVRRPPADVFAFLSDFTGYARHSRYLTDVVRDGDGGEGTEYDLTFAWWRLSHTVRSHVVAMERPRSIEWRLRGDLDVRGRWLIEPLREATRPERGGEGRAALADGDGTGNGEIVEAEGGLADAEAASLVRMQVDYDADTASRDVLDLPRFVSMGWLLDRAVEAARSEAERVVASVVRDLEGRPREVELTIERGSAVGDSAEG